MVRLHISGFHSFSLTSKYVNLIQDNFIPKHDRQNPITINQTNIILATYQWSDSVNVSFLQVCRYSNGSVVTWLWKS